MTGLLLLSACSGGSSVTENNLAEPSFKDGVAPTLTSVSIRESTKSAKPSGTVKVGKAARIDITASEALMKPRVTINDVEAEVIGKVNGWFAIRGMTEEDELGEVYFSIVYQDISGELGAPVSATTDGSALLYCDDDVVPCPEPVSLPGDWKLDPQVDNPNVAGAGVGPASGDISWWNTGQTAGGIVPEIRACLFDDVFRFGAAGSFQNVQGDETWLEPWQGVVGESCGAPVAPHDGSNPATWEYDEGAGTITITGAGAHLGFAKAVNGAELPAVAVPDSIEYQVVALEADSMTVTLDTGNGSWWTFTLVRQPKSPLAGKWRLDPQVDNAEVAGAGVGPASGDISWWNTGQTAGGIIPDLRDCWFDDVFAFGDDGSFQNIQGADTWLEQWQGVAADSCGAPVAPHDGSNDAIYQYDEEASTLKITGLGAHLGLAKAVNGAELAAPSETPESVTYNVLTLDGDTMTVTIDVGGGSWWTFTLVRVSNSPLVGKWKLDPQVDNATVAGAGVGPASGDISWWNTGQTAGGIVPEIRACWFDDVFHFGDDGSFQNYHGTETWLEPWQGVAGESCGAPVAPHDGTTAGVWMYDEAAGTLALNGAGSYIGLAKVLNGAELPNVAVPDSIVYNVLSVEGNSMTVTIDIGDGAWWTFTLLRVDDAAALQGQWRLDPQVDNAAVAGAGVGPASGDISWWNTGQTAGGIVPDIRACWFDDVFTFGADGSFMNDQGADTWLEQWQGVAADSCGAPVAPHDGSARAIFEFDDTAGELTIHGRGAHVGLAKAVNGGELTDPALAPDSVTYDVLALDGDTMTVTIDVGTGWWTFTLVRVSNLPIVGNWKLDPQVDNATVAGAGVGPASGDISWWNTGQTAGGIVPEIRACWFDDVFHFGGGGGFQNFQDGDTWLEPWQGVAGESCGAPVAPHDGGSAGSFNYDSVAETLRVRGAGSHVGLAKVVNGGELPNVAVPDFIDYDVLSFDEGTMTVTIDIGDGAWWTFTLVKE
jgi:hypothetical protein